MQHSAELRRCLEHVDVAGMRRLSAHIWPHLPQPANDQAALVAIHHARTQMSSIALKLRAYSHRWLLDNGYPSGLPDDLKPAAERIYPRVAEAVGIAVKGNSELGRAVAPFIRGAMEYAVEDIYADIKSPDPIFVKGRMQEARKGAVRKLLGVR